MSLTKRQFDLLQAMEINVWQRRDLPAQLDNNISTKANTFSGDQEFNNLADKSSSTTSQENLSIGLMPIHSNPIEPNLTELRNQQFFIDVIHCLGVNSSDLSIQQKQVDLGLINWQFRKQQQIEFSHNCLKTPEIKTITHSPKMKKQLWQLIQQISI